MWEFNTYSARMSPENSHKLMGFYMEVLILGDVCFSTYMISALFSCFFMGAKELMSTQTYMYIDPLGEVHIFVSSHATVHHGPGISLPVQDSTKPMHTGSMWQPVWFLVAFAGAHFSMKLPGWLLSTDTAKSSSQTLTFTESLGEC